MMTPQMIIKLRSWDGIHVDYLTQLYAANLSKVDFFEDLITICVNEPDLQKTTTWLIKHHYDKGYTLSEILTERLLTSCKTVENWEAKLHLLQLLPHFKLTEKSITITYDFARNCLTDKNKFVRAWAYSGLYELTKYIPDMRTELEFICQKAMETESASIRSKVKKILFEVSKKKTNEQNNKNVG
jgi:hypothetical protein